MMPMLRSEHRRNGHSARVAQPNRACYRGRTSCPSTPDHTPNLCCSQRESHTKLAEDHLLYRAVGFVSAVPGLRHCPQGYILGLGLPANMEFCQNAQLLAMLTLTLTATQQRRKLLHASKITINNVQEHFCYLQRYQVLVCKEHATRIQNINVHLRNQHSVASKERKSIIERCQQQQIAALQDVKLPALLGLLIKALGKLLDVY